MKRQLQYLSAALMCASAMTLTAMETVESQEELKARLMTVWEGSMSWEDQNEFEGDFNNFVKKTTLKVQKELKDTPKLPSTSTTSKVEDTVNPQPSSASAESDKKGVTQLVIGDNDREDRVAEILNLELVSAKEDAEKYLPEILNHIQSLLTSKFSVDEILAHGDEFINALGLKNYVSNEVKRRQAPTLMALAEANQELEASKGIVEQIKLKLEALHDDGNTIKASELKILRETLDKAEIEKAKSQLLVKDAQEERDRLREKVTKLEEENIGLLRPFYKLAKELMQENGLVQDLFKAIDLAHEELNKKLYKSSVDAPKLQNEVSELSPIFSRKTLEAMTKLVPSVKTPEDAARYLIEHGIEIGDSKSKTILTNVEDYLRLDEVERDRVNKLEIKYNVDVTKLIKDFVHNLDLPQTKALMSVDGLKLKDGSNLDGKATDELVDNKKLITGLLNVFSDVK